MSVIDPIVFASDMAQQALIHLPIKGESKYARRCLADFFANFYDCPIFSPMTPRSRRSYVRKWMNKSIQEINERGFVVFVANLATCGNAFLHSFVHKDGCLTYEAPVHEFPPPFHSVEGFVMKALNANDEDTAVVLADWYLSASLSLSKLPLTRPDLSRKETEAWIERQHQVKTSLQYRADIIEAMRAAVTYLFDEADIDNYEGRHGPGTTSLGHKLVPEKESAFQHCIQSAQISSYRLETSTLVDDRPTPSRFILVKKDIKSMRPITAESIAMQFSQQKLKRFMYELIDGGHVMASRFIKFGDQTRSQRLALKGSTGNPVSTKPVTIDLSSASDLLSVDLVSSVFTGDLLHYLMCSRTWEIDVNGARSTANMFAGMGSAVTFPVQTIIFTAVALLAACRSIYIDQFGDHKISYMDALREYLRQDMRRQQDVYKYFTNICVYGDDIIVPEIATTELFFLLEHLGLKVNRSKSFFGSTAVREACGVYALAGRDITPVRFRVPVWDTLADFAVYESLRTHVNHAFLKGRTHLYRFRMRLLNELKPFISTADRIRKTVNVSSCGKRILNMFLGSPKPLYEEFRGDDVDYIGVLSTRPVDTDCSKVFNLGFRTLTTYAAKIKTVADTENDSYYYLQNRYISSVSDGDQTAHGRIPRGIRLVKRIAYRRSDGRGWAWVPNQV
jgi:hypothetical protein